MEEIARKDEVIKDMYEEMSVYSEEDFLTPCYDRDEYLKELGREQGEEKGLKEGKKQKLMEIVKSMLFNNMNIEDIAKITKISIEEVNSIKDNDFK